MFPLFSNTVISKLAFFSLFILIIFRFVYDFKGGVIIFVFIFIFIYFLYQFDNKFSIVIINLTFCVAVAKGGGGCGCVSPQFLFSLGI